MPAEWAPPHSYPSIATHCLRHHSNCREVIMHIKAQISFLQETMVQITGSASLYAVPNLHLPASAICTAGHMTEVLLQDMNQWVAWPFPFSLLYSLVVPIQF